MPDRHSGWDGMRVDDDVGSDAVRGEWHVLLSVGDTDRTLLTVSGRKLVSDLGHSSTPDLDLDEFVTLPIRGDHDLVDDTLLGRLERRRDVPLLVQLRALSQLLALRR